MNQSKKNSAIIFSAFFVIIAGLIVITGWIVNVPILQSIIPGFRAMKFNAALCFVFFGCTLLLTQYPIPKYGKLLFLMLCIPGILISLITLFEDLLHFDTGLDQFFVIDKTMPTHLFPVHGRMAFNAAINFILLGFGFLSLTIKKRIFSVISQYLFQTVVILSFITLIGYLYGATLFGALFFVTSMATHTVILFLILSLTASLLNPSVGIARLFTGKQVGNQMAKRLFTLMILMVIAFGSLSIQFHERHFRMLSIETVISLLAISFLLISLLLIWNTANWLNRIDSQRSDAEKNIILMNVNLEKIVRERSAEFQKSEEKYRSLIEQASDAIYVLDFKGDFTDVNASMCIMIGYSRDELLQLNIRDIVDPEELKSDPITTNIYTGASFVRERRYRHKEGRVFVAEINVKMFTDDRIMVIARDITYRKKMESELREAELKFRTVADKSMVGVYIVQKGKFTYVNPRFAEIFDYEPGELTNTFPLEIIIAESHRAITTEHVRKRMAGEVESVNYETMGRKKDGSANWVEFYGSRVIIGDEPTIIGSMIDITERKRAEEELRSSEQKYKLLFESNPMPMWMIAKDDQTIIAVNDAAANHYGYQKEELLHMNTRSLRAKEDNEQQLEGYKLDFNNSTDFRVVRHLKKDGTMMYVQLTSQDIIFDGRSVRLSLTNDITEKLKAEDSLKKSEANLQTILKTTDTAYALFDTDLRVLELNPMAIEFNKVHYGHAPKKGDLLGDLFPPDRLSEFKKYAEDVLKGNNINYEIGYPVADGSVRWYYIRLFPITNDNKEILGMLMGLYDISERKNAEQDLKSAYERIQNHINSIKDMAWKQSHLIRSPLANLKGLVALQKEDPKDTIVFNHIQNELDRMDTIIIQMAEEATGHEKNHLAANLNKKPDL
ncbi:MAG: domain S-box protein [Mucilaginibacter sp.]|nr:domain S-box protein [Mucilaginibacter sp.]